MKLGALAVVLLIPLWSTQAIAAKNANIIGKNATLLGEPSKNSDVLGSLPEGEAVEISNLPTEGFYKVRTPDGQVGWILGESLQIEGAPAVAAPAQGAASGPGPGPGNQDSNDEELPPPPGSPISTVSSPAAAQEFTYEDVGSPSGSTAAIPDAGPRIPFEVKLFGGIQKLTMTDLNNLLGATPFNWTPYYGFQVGYPLQKRLRLLLRLDLIRNTTNVSGIGFQLSSTPLMTGLSWELIESKKKDSFSLQASFLLGASLSTSVTATDTAVSAPNSVTLSSGTFTEMLKFDFNFPLGNVVAFYMEAGWRFLKAPSVGPSASTNASFLFQTNGANTPVPLDLSGPFAGAGLRFLL